MATADFSLNETALALDEIVVTGTAAAVRAKEVGNSLDAITSRELQNIPVRNSEDILAGRAPGVTVMTNSGQPGAGATVKIRGLNSISQTDGATHLRGRGSDLQRAHPDRVGSACGDDTAPGHQRARTSTASRW